MQNAPDRQHRSPPDQVNSPLYYPPLSLAVADGVSLVDELSNFLADYPEGNSEEFVFYLRSVRRCSSSMAPMHYMLVQDWRAWLQPDTVQWRLLNFFSSVYVDFGDYDLIQLLERWHRLLQLAGPEWEDGVLHEYVNELNQHFEYHPDYTCRQSVLIDDVIYLYRHFGIVPSHSSFASARAQMERAIEWVAKQFDCLFARFRQAGSILSDSCRFCRIRRPEFTAEFSTVSALSSRRTQRHTMQLCSVCSSFVRKHTIQPYCPCCEQTIVRARHLPL